MEPLKAIRILGLAFVLFSFVAVLAFFHPFFLDPESPLYVFGSRREFVPHLYFWGGCVVFYLVLGLGVLFRTKWGYLLLKGFLYVLFVCFPIGTWISYKILSYIKRHELKQYFGARVLLL